jgi:GMP synthase (glutamine-hydrolysing)
MVWINQRQPGQEQILVVLHQEHSSPGRVGIMLQQMGYALDIRRPPLGHALPASLCDHAGTVIFGGPMSVNDNEEYVKREIDWIKVPLKENKPFFGICLGAQMLVKHLGGDVCVHHRGLAEIGYFPLHATDDGKTLMDWPPMIYQWHREGFSLPANSTLLAQGEEYPNQALRYGENAFGVQFHAELTFAMMNRWTTLGAHRFAQDGAQDRKKHFDGRYLYDDAIRAWLWNFLQLWVGNAGTPVTAALNRTSLADNNQTA